MDSKLKSAISKIGQDQAKGNHSRALKRVDDALKKFPDAVELYRGGVDVSLEAGETTVAIRLLKSALRRFPAEQEGFMELVQERVSPVNDGPIRKFLLEHAIRSRDLVAAGGHIEGLPHRTIRDLLQRTRMKRHSLTSAARGGYAVSEESMTNLISEFVLSARLGHADDAAAAAGRVLDARIEEAEALEQPLRAFADAHPRSAPTRFVLARCLAQLSMYKEASGNLLQAVRLDSETGPAGLELLRDIGENFDEMPEPIEHALLELLLMTGTIDRAVELIRRRLEEAPEKAEELVDLVVPHLPDGGPVTPLHIALLDAAVACDRMGRVVSTIKGLDEEDGNRARLLEWLGDPNKGRMLSPEVMFQHAQMLIDDEDYHEAVRLLRALCVSSHGDIPRVLRLMQAHRDDDREVATFCDEIAGHKEQPAQEEEPAPMPATSPEAKPASDGEFDVFESSEFQFSAGSDDGSEGFDVLETPDKPIANTDTGNNSNANTDTGNNSNADANAGNKDSDFDIYDGANILGGSTTAAASAPVASSYDGSRRPLDDNRAGIVWEEESVDAFDSQPSQPAPEVAESAAEDVPQVTAEHVQNVAEELYTAGASTFFHVEGNGAAADEHGSKEPTATAPEREPESTTEAEPEPPTEPAPLEESFEQRFSRFLDGGLGIDAVVDLMEEAVDDARTNELGELMRGVDEDAWEHDEAMRVRARLCEAEYLLMCERPNDSLDTLKGLRGADLSEEQRKAMWLKTVACQRMRGDLDAAHSTLVQLVDLYPDCPEVAQLAKQNYREYLQNQCTEATVLEKVTSLERDT